MKLSALKYWVDEHLKNNGDGEVSISVDISTNEEDSVRRIFADPISIIYHGDIGYAILSEMTEDNMDRI